MTGQLNTIIDREDQCVAAVPEEKKKAAAEFLANELPEDIKKTFKELIEKGNDRFWFSKYHFYGGMEIRNLLRQNGFSEEDLGIENLDFIYCQLIERTIMGSEIDWDAHNDRGD